MSSTKEKIEVMKAYDRGEEIEFKFSKGNDKWSLLDRYEGKPVWNWEKIVYRIKTTSREIWLNEYESEGVRKMGGCVARTRKQADQSCEEGRIAVVRFVEVERVTV